MSPSSQSFGVFKQVLAAGPSAETWEASRPFPETRKTLFFAVFFLTVFACNFSSGLWVEWFHRGFGVEMVRSGLWEEDLNLVRVRSLNGAFGGRPPLAL